MPRRRKNRTSVPIFPRRLDHAVPTPSPVLDPFALCGDLADNYVTLRVSRVIREAIEIKMKLENLGSFSDTLMIMLARHDPELFKAGYKAASQKYK
ncbi:MAG: hypothetical protein KC496_11495 [Anaerolineae bacterium]|nr:hypothetical protein [Anaerolineae bacterium]